MVIYDFGSQVGTHSLHIVLQANFFFFFTSYESPHEPDHKAGWKINMPSSEPSVEILDHSPNIANALSISTIDDNISALKTIVRNLRNKFNSFSELPVGTPWLEYLHLESSEI